MRYFIQRKQDGKWIFWDTCKDEKEAIKAEGYLTRKGLEVRIMREVL